MVKPNGDIIQDEHDATLLAKRVVLVGFARSTVVENTITVTGTGETTLLTAVTGYFLDLTALTIANTSATGVRVDVRDATAGTVKFSFWVPANDTRGIVFQIPKPQSAVSNNWTVQASASVTDLRIYAQAVKML